MSFPYGSELGVSGEVTIDATGSRESLFHFTGLADVNDNGTAFIEVKFTDSNIVRKRVNPLLGH